MSLSEDDLLVVLLVHSLPQFEYGVDPAIKQINVMYHTWAFKGNVCTLICITYIH